MFRLLGSVSLGLQESYSRGGEFRLRSVLVGRLKVIAVSQRLLSRNSTSQREPDPATPALSYALQDPVLWARTPSSGCQRRYAKVHLSIAQSEAAAGSRFLCLPNIFSCRLDWLRWCPANRSSTVVSHRSRLYLCSADMTCAPTHTPALRAAAAFACACLGL